jgi:hypothetical protein
VLEALEGLVQGLRLRVKAGERRRSGLEEGVLLLKSQLAEWSRVNREVRQVLEGGAGRARRG